MAATSVGPFTSLRRSILGHNYTEANAQIKEKFAQVGSIDALHPLLGDVNYILCIEEQKKQDHDNDEVTYDSKVWYYLGKFTGEEDQTYKFEKDTLKLKKSHTAQLQFESTNHAQRSNARMTLYRAEPGMEFKDMKEAKAGLLGGQTVSSPACVFYDPANKSAIMLPSDFHKGGRRRRQNTKKTARCAKRRRCTNRKHTSSWPKEKKRSRR